MSSAAGFEASWSVTGAILPQWASLPGTECR
jgi:hypothetical protein